MDGRLLSQCRRGYFRWNPKLKKHGFGALALGHCYSMLPMWSSLIDGVEATKQTNPKVFGRAEMRMVVVPFSEASQAAIAHFGAELQGFLQLVWLRGTVMQAKLAEQYAVLDAAEDRAEVPRYGCWDECFRETPW